MYGEYNEEDLLIDLNLLIDHGFIEYQLSDDGQWVYRITEKAKSMPEEEVAEYISNIVDDRHRRKERNA